jgi:hypothetical protein
MKKQTLLTAAALAAAAALCGGCLSSPGGLAPSTMPITARDSYTVVQADVTGGEGTIGIIAIPLYPNSAYDSLQKTKAKYGADALINVSIENKTYWPLLLPLITYHQIEIRGDAIKLKRGEKN